MLLTVEDIYNAFLDGIKKEQIGTVSPLMFNRFINEGQGIWLSEQKELIDQGQKNIDDLQVLDTVTDGIFSWNGTVLEPISLTNDRCSLPIDPSTPIGGISYPRYWRLDNIQFKITYSGNSCYDDGTVSDWLPAKILKGDKETVIERDPYRKPKDTRLYYKEENNKIVLYTGTNSTGYQAKLRYKRYPVEIVFDANTPLNNVTCELAPRQRQEIVDITVRTYIERAKDSRYRSLLIEENLKTDK